MSVSCTTNKIKVMAKSKVLLQGDFIRPVKASEMVWNLMPGSHILVTLEKGCGQASLWPKLLGSEDKSVALTYDSDIDQLNESDKMACEYVMHQQATNEKEGERLKGVLKAAWHQEGSPFKGQPFDPTVLSNIK